MFYDRYVALCQKHGVSPSRAALDAGLSKSTVTKWKNDPNALPTGNVIDKLIRYFGVSVSDLLGESNLCADPEARKVEPVEIRTTLPGKTEPFYDRFLYLARCKGVSPSKAALDAGLSKSIVTKWKNDPTAIPTGSVIGKLSNYFAVPVSELMGEAPEAPEARPVTDEELKFALFGGSEDITDEMFEEVRSFAAFVRQREAAKGK